MLKIYRRGSKILMMFKRLKINLFGLLLFLYMQHRLISKFLQI